MVRKKEGASSEPTKTLKKETQPKKEKDASSKKGKQTESSVSVPAPAPERTKPSRVLNLKNKAPVNDYLAGVDLPPSEDEMEEDEEVELLSDEERPTTQRGRSNLPIPLSIQTTERDLRKKEKKVSQLAAAQTQAREEAMKQDDDSAFSVVLGSKMASTEGEEGLDDKAKDIKIENFSVTARGKELYNNASLTIVHGRRYGLVGPNGKGKSVLMKLLASRKLPVPKSIDVLLVEQEVVGNTLSALEAVVSADEELMRLKEEEAKLKTLAEKEGEEEEKESLSLEKLHIKDAHKLEEDEKDEEEDEEEEEKGIEEKKSKKAKPKAKSKKNKRAMVKETGEKREEKEEKEEGGLTAGERLADVYERMQLIGAASAESRASKILAGLGFTKDMQARPTQSFSGGWRMRISLARALYVQPTLLLLDEPTNHLDLRAVLWLEEYLLRWKKTLMVVSHDRDFLNSVCSDIVHLSDCKLHLYKGNFETFEQMYEQKRRENNKRAEVYEKQMNAAKKTGNKASMEKAKERAEMKEARMKKKDKKGKGGEEDDDNKPKEIPKKWKEYIVEFHFPEPTELTPPLLQLRNVEFQYPNRTDFALTNLDLGIDMGTRVAIVGPNGAGKSTLLNLLAGDLEPTKGEARQSQKLRVGRYSQHFVDVLQFDETPVQYLLRLFPDQEGPSKQEAVRSKLGKFGLPSHNHVTPIVKLSGGQKARVVFTAISMSRPHILLLDEPTNHLDMQSIDALADALDEFTGGVVLVSHDSRLISRVCEDEERSEIWVVDEGTCTTYLGSFEEYKGELVKEIIAEVED